MVYRYISSKPFYYQSELLIGVEFQSDWLTITRDGNLVIPEQIRWDWPLFHKLAPAVKEAAKELGVEIQWGRDERAKIGL